MAYQDWVTGRGDQLVDETLHEASEKIHEQIHDAAETVGDSLQIETPASSVESLVDGRSLASSRFGD